MCPPLPPSTGNATFTSANEDNEDNKCDNCDDCDKYIVIIIIVGVGSFVVGVLLTIIGTLVKECIGKSISVDIV